MVFLITLGIRPALTTVASPIPIEIENGKR